MPHYLFESGLPYGMRSFPCSYYSNQTCTEFFTHTDWLEELSEGKFSHTELYNDLVEHGYRRAGGMFYTTMCDNCRQCTPIRLYVPEFKLSKSQRHVYRLNQDLEITMETEPQKFVTTEKAHLYREYDYYHNGQSGSPRMTLDEAKECLTAMNGHYDGVINMEYRLNGLLVGVAVLDILTKEGSLWGLSSNYFYYDVSPEIKKRSLGVFSVIKEIEFCQISSIPFYHLGLYLPDCKKMNYKTNYKPYQLYINGKWTRQEDLPEQISKVIPSISQKKEYPNLVPSKVIPLPPAGSEAPMYPDLCFVTDSIPLITLYSAYRQGIFPWFNEEDGDPVLWQSPSERFVLFPNNFHVSKSLEKFLKKDPFTYTVDTCFTEVMTQCQKQIRKGQNSTWIGNKMIEAYTKMHEAGIAHSFEVWKDGQLAGGFYGLQFGALFCGESMFTKESNSSKAIFVRFAQSFFSKGGLLIDCQAYTDNMARYGAETIPRDQYLWQIEKLIDEKVDFSIIKKQIEDTNKGA